jgi:hypothetical protein
MWPVPKSWLLAVAIAFLSVSVLIVADRPIAVQPPSASRVMVAGVTDMGKTHWVREYAHDIRRLLVWDPERDWAGDYALGGGRISIEELVERTRDGRHESGVLRLAVRPSWRQVRKKDRSAHRDYRRGELRRVAALDRVPVPTIDRCRPSPRHIAGRGWTAVRAVPPGGDRQRLATRHVQTDRERRRRLFARAARRRRGPGAHARSSPFRHVDTDRWRPPSPAARGLKGQQCDS